MNIFDEAFFLSLYLSVCYRNALMEAFGWMWLARAQESILTSLTRHVRSQL